jgi:DnaJ-class molecular chaperone
MNPELSRLAEYHFGLQLPVASISLKKAYRRKSLELHPDAGGDERLFKEMQAAYNTLVEHSSIIFEGETEYGGEAKTVEGIPLSELGLGLGPTTNGTDCPDCGHRGYVENHGSRTKRCDHCTLGLVRSAKCRACSGTGRFEQRRSKRVVECRVCRGSGRFIYRRPVYCSTCGGTGVVWEETGAVTYGKCYKCKGKGEIPIWNPVIQKGAMR